MQVEPPMSVRLLSEVASVLMGQSPPSSACGENNHGLPFLQGNAEFTARFPKSRFRCSSRGRICEAGDMLLSVRAPVGEINQADQPYVIGRGLCAIRFAGLPPAFGWHALRYSVPQLNRLAQGSTFTAVSRADVETMRIPCCGNTVAASIAAVLDSADEAIEWTEAVIAKLRLVRAGFLHDLLTRGLDHNGQLRDRPEDAPDAYQHLDAGFAPRTWMALPLREACQWFSGGTPSRSKPQWWTGDFPWLTPKDMKVFELADTSEHVTEEAASVGSKIVPAETAFIVVRGMILAHTFPVVICTRPFAFNQDIRALRGQHGLKTRFLAYWLSANASLFLRKATEATHGTKRLDPGDVLPLHIAFPDLAEQDAILRRITDFDALLNNEVICLEKLGVLKSGLAADLLTGRVHVVR